MRRNGRILLLIVAVLVIAAILVWVKVAEADWRLCFARNDSSLYDHYRQMGAWAIAREALTLPSLPDLIVLLYAMPALLAIAAARRRGVQIFALALLAAPLAWLLAGGVTTSGMHSCDGHGCMTCEFIGAWVVFIQLPLGSLLLIGLLVHRVLAALVRTHARSRA